MTRAGLVSLVFIGLAACASTSAVALSLPPDFSTCIYRGGYDEGRCACPPDFYRPHGCKFRPSPSPCPRDKFDTVYRPCPEPR